MVTNYYLVRPSKLARFTTAHLWPILISQPSVLSPDPMAGKPLSAEGAAKGTN